MSSVQRMHRFYWQQTMLRIKDPARTVPFYREHFGLQLIHKYDFPQWKFSLYFMGTFPSGTVLPEPGTAEAEQFLWNMTDGACLEFTHNHGSETDDTFKVNTGNVEPHRGFGHIAMMTPDVYASCAKLEADGVAFQKKPDEGRMKGLAFALDPDGYWVEIIRRAEQSPIANPFTLAQTMQRIKDPEKSLRFYRDILGMDLISVREFGKGTDWGFSLYFLATLTDEQRAALPADPTSEEAADFPRHMFQPVLELTHNHGTENDPNF
ncbi:GLO1, partial [Symbiodinium microadriaticum]